MDLIALAEKWLAESRYSRATKKTYLINLQLLARRYPDKPVDAFTEQDLVLYLNTDKDGLPSPHAPNTVVTRRNALRSFFAWAEDTGLVKRDPAIRLVHKVKPRIVSVRTTHRWLSRDECSKLVAACGDDAFGLRDRMFITLALHTGLRRNELVSLHWGQVDLDRGVIHVASTSAKGGKAALVGITPQCRDAVRAWRTFYVEDNGFPPPADECLIPPVIFNPRMTERHYVRWGLPLGKRGLATAIEVRAKKAGIGHVAPHDLRRTFCALLKEGGASLEDRQAAMRHSSPVTTQQVYDKRDPRQAIRALDHLGSF